MTDIHDKIDAAERSGRHLRLVIECIVILAIFAGLLYCSGEKPKPEHVKVTIAGAGDDTRQTR